MVNVSDFGSHLAGVEAVDQQRRDYAPNAMDNFCFDVTLGYRRLERPRRPGTS